MSLLTKSIDHYVDDLLASGEDIVHGEAADVFIAAHSDVIGEHVGDLVRREICAAIKKRSQAPAPPMGQGVLFAGLPAAVTIADGITRPIDRCTRADLALGRGVKVDNISAAIAALDAYDTDVARLIPFMGDDETTVGQIVHRLAGAA